MQVSVHLEVRVDFLTFPRDMLTEVLELWLVTEIYSTCGGHNIPTMCPHSSQNVFYHIPIALPKW